jgi:DNA-binding transcriptional ArsR family regulator
MAGKSHPLLDSRTATRVAELFRTFSDTSRVQLLYLLATREYNAGALAGLTGITESALSQHIRKLRQMGLVSVRRYGKAVYYHIDDEPIINLFRQGVSHIRQDDI